MVGRQGDFYIDRDEDEANQTLEQSQWLDENVNQAYQVRQGGNTRFGEAIYLAQADMNERYYATNGDDYPSFNEVWNSALEQKRQLQIEAMEAQGIGADGRQLEGYEYLRKHYYPQRQYENTQEIQTHGQRSYPVEQMSAYDAAVFERLSTTVNSLVGHKITEYDHRVSTDLGCARAVSLAVKYGYGYSDVDDMSVAHLEKNLRQKGFQDVTVNQIKPGDVILGFREEGDYPHAGVYMGNGYIFNNDSSSEAMQIQSAEKYNSAEFKRFVILRRPAVVPGVKELRKNTPVADNS
jgi:hypothetical protein